MKKRLIAVLAVAVLALSACGSQTAKLNSIMANLDKEASVADMVDAFENDYNRAAEAASIAASYNDLEYTENSGMATIQITDSMMIMIDPPSTYHRVWYAGYADSDDWMKQEALLTLMAADDTLSTEDATALIDEIYKETWDNRNKMPSAVSKKTKSGVNYSLSLSDNGLTSFQISY